MGVMEFLPHDPGLERMHRRRRVCRRCGWALAIGALFSLPIPWLLGLVGLAELGMFMLWPGLLPIVWATGGWFARLSVEGIAVMTGTNMLVYSAIAFASLQICASVRSED